MKQILPDMKGRATYLAEAPAPAAGQGSRLIASRISLISAGTDDCLSDSGGVR